LDSVSQPKRHINLDNAYICICIVWCVDIRNTPHLNTSSSFKVCNVDNSSNNLRFYVFCFISVGSGMLQISACLVYLFLFYLMTFTCGSLLKYILKFFSTIWSQFIYILHSIYLKAISLELGLKSYIKIHLSTYITICTLMFQNMDFLVNAERVREVAKHTQKR